MKKKQKKRKQIKLHTKVVIGLWGSGLIIMIVLSLVIGLYYFSASTAEYTNMAFNMARSAARFIDGDRVPDYLEVVGTDAEGRAVYYTDEYDAMVMDYLVSVQSEFELVKYFYVFVPRGNTCVFVWDAVSADKYSPRGEVSPLNELNQAAVDLAFTREPQEMILVEDSEKWGRVISAFTPVFNSAGDPVAIVGVDLSLDGVVEELFLYVLLIVAAVLLVTAVLFAVMIRIVRRLVIRPIEKLNNAAKDIVGELSGETQFDLDIRTGDELEELANSFRKMDGDLREYVDRLTAVKSEQERVHAEFGIVKEIQKGILPNVFPAFPERSDFDIYASLYSGVQIGGDYFDFFLIDDDHLAMAVGDVAGKGVPASLYMVMVETLIKSRAMQGFSPAEVLQSVNEQMLAYHMDQFSMVWLAVLELSTGSGIAANAGHEHPILRRAGKRFELQKYEHTPPVGAVEGVRFRDHGFRLAPGDSLFIYSDGVREAFNERNEMFGTKGILDSLNRDPEATPSVLLQTVKADVDRFGGQVRQADDIAMLALKYYGPGGAADRI